MERLELALAFQVTLHVGDVRVVAAVALHFVQDFEEHPQDSVPARACGSALLSMLNRMTSVFEATARLMSPKSMASLILLSKNSTACLLWPSWRVRHCCRRYDKHLDEVGLAGAEKAGNPDAHLSGDHAQHRAEDLDIRAGAPRVAVGTRRGVWRVDGLGKGGQPARQHLPPVAQPVQVTVSLAHFFERHVHVGL